jgi:hypothetical protein
MDDQGDQLWDERLYDEPLNSYSGDPPLISGQFTEGDKDHRLAALQVSPIPRTTVTYARYAPGTVVVATR